MKRIECQERPAWKSTAKALGFHFHTIDGERYWDESAYYQFSLRQIEDDLEEPTRELHQMCLDMVDLVVRSEELLRQLAIPKAFFDLVRTSWLEGHPHLYGRMDFAYDGTGPAKLLELNYDTPTSLYESSAFQWIWLEQQKASGALPAAADQYNSIDEKLAQVFSELRAGGLDGPLYFSSVKGHLEDRATTDFMRDIAHQQGIVTGHIDIEDIGLQDGRLVDLDDRWIPHLFKLYPWEFMFQEDFGRVLPGCDTQFIEPAWKAILSNKGILPLLWEKHKGHPNLLPCFFDREPQQALTAGWVRKPFFSREGANIELVADNGEHLRVDGPYTDAPYIRQAFNPLPRFADSYTMIGSWVIGDVPAGIGIREDDSLITKDSSRFLPHIILD